MITRLFLCGSLVVLVTLTLAQDVSRPVSRPDVPAKIKAPADEVVILRALASGSQIYTCQETQGKYAWTLKAPDAELRDPQGQGPGPVIGKHYAGPTWKHNDGSEVIGKAVARVDSPDSNSIPWLLVSATSHSGDGLFSRVTTIQRIHTHAGQPPPAADCSASKRGQEAKSSYTAEYVFYAPGR